MPFNRVNGFYVGNFSEEGITFMGVEDQNKELNELLDNRLGQLNAAIEAHETALRAMMVPRDTIYCFSSEYDLDSNGAPQGEWCHYLGILKRQGSWRLCYCYHYYHDESALDWKPLVDSSIADRLRAVPHLGQLREKVVEEKKRMIPELESAIQELAKSLNQFDVSNPKKKK